MKKSHRPITKVKNPEPKSDSPNWVIWQHGRIGSLLRILKKTGKSESDVIKIMRKILNRHLLNFGEKEQKIKVLNTEKSLKIQEKK